jgi:hypothetical protein
MKSNRSTAVSEFKIVTPEILNELSRPIPRSQLKNLTKKWKDKRTGEQKEFTVQHITARTVMNRLDETVGRYNWRTHYKPVMVGNKSGVECTIEILIEAEWIGKTDVGTPTDIEPEKGAYSDALKRAAAHWGIARELYGDGNVYDEEDSEAQSDMFLWTPAKVREFVAKAEAWWNANGNPVEARQHAIHRAVLALGLSQQVDNDEDFAELMYTEYEGDWDAAAKACKLYAADRGD